MADAAEGFVYEDAEVEEDYRGFVQADYDFVEDLGDVEVLGLGVSVVSLW